MFDLTGVFTPTTESLVGLCHLFFEAKSICYILWMIYLLYFPVEMFGCFWVFKSFNCLTLSKSCRRIPFLASSSGNRNMSIKWLA